MSAVLEKSSDDSSRQPFAVCVEGAEASDVVGVGVLQPEGADEHLWPSRRPHVLLRGFSVDAGFQGQGIGTDATRKVVALAQRRFPSAAALVLRCTWATSSGNARMSARASATRA